MVVLVLPAACGVDLCCSAQASHRMTSLDAEQGSRAHRLRSRSTRAQSL